MCCRVLPELTTVPTAYSRLHIGGGWTGRPRVLVFLTAEAEFGKQASAAGPGGEFPPLTGICSEPPGSRCMAGAGLCVSTLYSRWGEVAGTKQRGDGREQLV